MGYLSRGRHRKKAKSRSKVWTAALVVALLPVVIAFGYFEVSAHADYPLAHQNAYADVPLVSLTPVPPPSAAPPSIVAMAAPDTPTPTIAPQKPTQGDVSGPVEKDQDPPTQSHQTQDPKPSAKPTAPPVRPAPAKANPKCSNLEAKDNVVRACNTILSLFPQVSAVGGRGARPDNPTSCHPFGMALDVMVGSNSLGDSINAWAHANRAEYEIAYIGWEVPDHWDHVHLSFKPCKG